MIQQPVQQLLAEWREAEREASRADDPAHRESLTSRVVQLREAYHRAIASVESRDEVRIESRSV
jgi:hypothetical protein